MSPEDVEDVEGGSRMSLYSAVGGWRKCGVPEGSVPRGGGTGGYRGAPKRLGAGAEPGGRGGYVQEGLGQAEQGFPGHLEGSRSARRSLILFSVPGPVQGSRPGKNVQLTENEIRGLCLKSREIFLSQPILLELEAPLKICGEAWVAAGQRWGGVGAPGVPLTPVSPAR